MNLLEIATERIEINLGKVIRKDYTTNHLQILEDLLLQQRVVQYIILITWQLQHLVVSTVHLSQLHEHYHSLVLRILSLV